MRLRTLFDREMILEMVRKREGGVVKFNVLMQDLLQNRMLEALLLRYISAQVLGVHFCIFCEMIDLTC
jgi:hypothetical protein